MNGKKIKYLFRYLKDNGIYANFISEVKNFNIYNFKNFAEKDEAYAIISRAFSWSNTKMGEKFWYKHYTKFNKELYEKYGKNY